MSTQQEEGRQVSKDTGNTSTRPAAPVVGAGVRGVGGVSLSPIGEHKSFRAGGAVSSGDTASPSGASVSAISRSRRRVGVETTTPVSSGERSTLLIMRKSTAHKPENRYWRKLRLTLMSLIFFKLCKGDGLGWYFTNHSSGSKFLRTELLGFLKEGLTDIGNRNIESKYATLSPLRRFLFSKYALFVALLRDALSIISILEEKISAMEQRPELNYIYRAFHNIPIFRSGLCRYCECLCRSIESISDCLTKCDIDSVHPTSTYNLHMKASVECIANMLRARKAFDTAYFECRKQVYYDHSDLKSRIVYTNEDRTGAKSLPLQPEVLLNMNSFLFLGDALCSLVVQFWSPAELNQFQKCTAQHIAHKDGPGGDDDADAGSDDDSSEGSAAGGDGGQKVRKKLKGGSLSERFRILSASVSLSVSVFWTQARLASLDLFPNQMNALAGVLPWSTHPLQNATYAKLKTAFSVSLSMTIASVYGLYLDRNISFMAAFTIAYLAGGAVAGATMVTSLNRAAGTVVAAVIAIIVQFGLDRGGSSVHSYVIQRFVVGAVAVVVQVPATIVRSYPLQGYAGTCASFTICIMLFAPDLSSTAAIDRIIDTFVGVSIYLAVEAALATTYTENILLNNMKSVFEGVDDRFSGFQKNFKLFKTKSAERVSGAALPVASAGDANQAVSARGRGGRGKRNSIHGCDDAVDMIRRQYVLKDLDVEPVNQKIKLQGDLLRYVELEPGLRRPPNMPVNLLAECVALQAQAVKHIQVMYWAVKACADEDCDTDVAKHHALYIALAALASSPSVCLLAGASKKLCGEREADEVGSFQKNESLSMRMPDRAASPTSSIASASDDGTEAEGVPPAVAAVMEGRDTPSPTSGCDLSKSEHCDTVFYSRRSLASNVLKKIVPLKAATEALPRTVFALSALQKPPSADTNPVLSDTTASASASATNLKIGTADQPPPLQLALLSLPPSSDAPSDDSPSRASSAATLVAPDSSAVAAASPKFLLLPLEHSFISVGKYVSLVVSFLKLALLKMNTRPTAVQETNGRGAIYWGQSPNKALPPSRNTLRNVSKINDARVAANLDFLTRSIPESDLRAISSDAELLSKLEAQEIVALFSKFQAILEQLRGEVIGGVSTTVVVDGVRVRTPRQNKELKIVNAMVASTIELVTALKGLASAMSKMQAHRDIRMTQTGEKFM